MREADLTSGLGQLTQAFAKLQERWTQAQEHWNDDAGRRFGQSCLQPLPARLKLIAAAAGSLQRTIAGAQRELGDEAGEA
ncbi:MAG TPA: hypothetical protein VFV87_05185 [Pirellulaceae bacterium]|nr:hypothetical protein [Pirellulaceae bacterium]